MLTATKSFSTMMAAILPTIVLDLLWAKCLEPALKSKLWHSGGPTFGFGVGGFVIRVALLADLVPGFLLSQNDLNQTSSAKFLRGTAFQEENSSQTHTSATHSEGGRLFFHR